MLNLIGRIFLVALGLLAAARLVPGIEVSGFYIAVIVAVILGVLNITIKPVLFLLTLPINLLTLGLFTFVLNALLFWLTSTFIEGFSVDGFIPAFLGALAVTVVSWLAHKFLS